MGCLPFNRLGRLCAQRMAIILLTPGATFKSELIWFDMKNAINSDN